MSTGSPSCRRRHLMFVLWLAAPACTHDRPLEVTLRREVERPRRAAVLFLVDGLDATRMEQLLEAGELPNIHQRLMARGTVVESAVTVLPSITYASLTSILTGQYPGTHGICGNRWFDRARLRIHDYTTTRTYRLVDGDFRVPTIHEYLADELTVSIQCAVRRGATRVIDNWATSGINWFFGGFDQVNKLVAMRFELIARLANNVGRWPVLVNAYFPGTDETGHRFGADSEAYRRSLLNVDAQIGRILDGYRRMGLIDRTYFVLVSDHGHAPVDPQRRFDLEQWLARRAGLRLAPASLAGDSYEDRYLYLKSYDAVMIDGGNRRAHLHLKGRRGWQQRPSADEAIAVLSRGGALWNHRSVALVAVRAGPHRVVVLSSAGRATITRHRQDHRAEPAYALQLERGDPLGYAADPTLGQQLRAGSLSSDRWLRLTAPTEYPDFVPQIVELFDSPHAGEAVIFAASGAGFSPTNRGGHGSAGRRDMLVPMVWRGPDIPAGARIEYARTVDVTPTLLELLGRSGEGQDRSFDGTSLADRLRAARPAPHAEEY